MRCACSLVAVLLLGLMAQLSVSRAADEKLERLKTAFKDVLDRKQKGDLDGALQRCTEAVAQARADFGDTHDATATLLNELGMLHLGTGHFAEAEKHLRDSLGIFEELVRQKKLNGEALLLIQAQNNLAELYRLRDDYRQAEPLLRRSLDMLDRRLANATATDRPNLEHFKASALVNLAKTCEMMGEFPRAEGYYRDSLQVLKTDPARHARDRALALNNLGWLYHSMGKYADAETRLKEALDLRRSLKPKADPGEISESLNNLALLYHTTQRYAEARPLFEESLRTLRTHLGPKHPRVATVEHNLAGLLRSMGQTAEAERGFRNSLALLSEVEGGDHPDVAANRINLAGLHAAAGQWDAAAKEMDQARRSLRQHVARVLSAQSETQQLRFLDNKEERWFQAALSLGLQRGGDAPIAALSAAWVLNGKAVGLHALAQRPLLARDSSDDKVKLLRQRLQQARDQLAALSLSALITGQEEQRRTRWEKAVKDEDDLSRALAQALGLRTAGDLWVELDAVRKELPEDAVLVEIARFAGVDFASKGTEWKRLPAHYAAWVIPGKGPVRVVDLGEAAAIDAAVQAYQQELKAFFDLLAQKKGTLSRAEERASEARFLKPLEQLAKLVIVPLQIEATRRWIISPDAALWLVPWAALPVQDKFAVEDHPISLVASGRDLLPITSPMKLSPPVVFAGVDYGKVPAQDPPRLRFRYLDFSEAEGKAIAPKLELYAGQPPIIFGRTDATEKAFRSLRSPRIVVLSTHGFVRIDTSLGTRNPFVQCGLAFANANQRKSTSKADNDGILFGLEVLDVDLRGTELVMLSACETALGEVRRGEGVVSLQYAFLLAGARSVVATLWEVPDEPTAMLSRDFFTQLADGKHDKAEALRQAQLARIKERRELRRSTHPFLWADRTLEVKMDPIPHPKGATMKTLRWSLLALLLGLGLWQTLGDRADALSAYRRQYYGGWSWYGSHSYYYRHYYYKPYDSYDGYDYHYCIYYPTTPRYVYYYNPHTSAYWGRLDLQAKGENKYSLLEKKDRKKELKDIPESAFPEPGKMPAIPDSKDGASIDPIAPDDLPKKKE